MCSRLWNSVGIRVGQFGQHKLWDVKAPSTWRAREPSYMIHPLIRQVPDGVFSTARTPIRIPGERRSSEDESADEAKTEAPPLTPKVNVEELKRQYEARKNAVLDPGPPHLRLENWYTPLINAYERQLAIKKLSPLMPLLPPGLSENALEKAEILAAERSASPMSSASTKSKKKKFARSTPVAPPSKHDVPID